MRRAIVFLVCLLLAVPSVTLLAGARPDKNWKSWFGQFGIGYSLPQGDAGDIVDDAWYFDGGATYWPKEWPVGLNFDLAYSGYDVSNSAIQTINDNLPEGSGTVSGGSVDIWQTTANLQWSPMKGSGSTGFYLVAGVGAYYLDGQLTENGLVYYPPVCDPWWWWCYPGGVAPGTYVKASQTEWDFGWNAGLGVTIEVGTASQIYIEAKYHSVDTSNQSTDYIPITIGYRW